MPNPNTIDVNRPQTPAVTYRNSGQVRARYGGVSDMTLWRWLHDDDLGFPKPIRINGRRFWSEDQLVAWERSQAVLQMLGGEQYGDERAT